MIRDFDIGCLRTFTHVAHTGSFTLAAQKVFRSQSSASLQIKRLEEDLGQVLFFRNGRGVTLTPEGESLLTTATEILRLNDKAQTGTSAPLKERSVSVGVHLEFTLTRLVTAFSRLKSIHPEINLDITADAAGALKEGMIQGAYDIVLSRCEKEACENAYSSWKESLLWVAARDVRVDENEPIPLILPTEGSLLRTKALEALAKTNRRWNIVMQTPTTLGIQTAVEAGLGVSVMNRYSVPASLQVLPSPEVLPAVSSTQLALFVRSGNTSRAVKSVASVVRQCFDNGMLY